MPALPPIDAAGARRHLAAHLGHDPGPVTVLGRGEWSVAFAFAHGGRDLVARFAFQARDFAKDQRAATWAGPHLPVPAVLHVGPLGAGVHLAITERVPGTPLEKLDRAGWDAALPSLLHALEAIWRIDPGPATGWGHWDPAGHAPYRSWPEFLLAVAHDVPGTRVHGWRPRLAASPVGDAAFRRGVAALARVAGAGADHRRVVHSDLINGNVHVTGGRIAGVFDWGSTLLGDPLYEVAWLDVWAPWHPPMDELGLVGLGRARLESAGLSTADAEARLRAARIHILLASLTYCAFEGRTDDLTDVAARLVPFLDD